MDSHSIPRYLARPWWLLAAVLFAFAMLAIGVSKLTFRGDYRIFFDDDNPQVLAFDTIERTFNKNDNLSLLVAPPKGQLFSEKYLTLLRDLTEASWQTPHSSRVDSIANYQHTKAQGDDLLVADLVDKFATVSAADAQYAKAVALAQPELVGRLVAKSGDVAVVNVTIHLDEANKTAQVSEIAKFSDELVARFAQQYPEVQFHQAGIVRMNYSFFTAAQKDSSSLVPLMFLVVLVVIGVMLRSVTAVLTTLAVLIVAIVSTLAIAGWLGMAINTASVNVPTIVLTLAVADCVHIIASYRYGLQQGQSRREALALSLALNQKPVLITSVTTAIGFLTMNFSDVPAIREFGNLTALGVMLAWALSVSLLPALLSVMPFRVKPAATQAADSSDSMHRFSLWLTPRAKPVLWVSTALIVAAASFIGLNRINDESVKYFNHNSQFRQAADFMADHISGMSTLSVAIDSGRENGINDPEYLTTLAKFSDWLRLQPEVDNVVSLSDVFKRLNRSMNSDDPAQFRLPEQQDLAAQYLLLYEMSLPYGLDLNNQIDIQKSQSRVMMVLHNLGSKEMTEFEQRIDSYLASHAGQYHYLASSPALMFAHVGERNMQSMLTSLPIALLLISLLLVVALKDLKLGLFSLLPNVLPAAAGFGLWGLTVGEINLGLSVVASMTLGIIVDDTVHFLTKYQYGKHNGKTPVQAVHYAFATVGKALWVTTVVLVIGFGVLASSDFRLNADMGQLTALIIAIALLVDFFFLPAFLVLFDQTSKETADETVVQLTTH